MWFYSTRTECETMLFVHSISLIVEYWVLNVVYNYDNYSMKIYL